MIVELALENEIQVSLTGWGGALTTTVQLANAKIMIVVHQQGYRRAFTDLGGSTMM